MHHIFIKQFRQPAFLSEYYCNYQMIKCVYLSEGVEQSPRDFFWNREWGILQETCMCVWKTALAVYAVAYFCLIFFTRIDILGILN